MWHKMWRADLFDLAIYDQFQSRGYQRRVTMREKWASLPVIKAPVDTPINKIEIAPMGTAQLRQMIKGRYEGSRYWAERSGMVMDWITDAEDDLLWRFNLSLILSVKEYLGIETPIAIASPLRERGIDGVIEAVSYYGPLVYNSRTADSNLTYLSGGGGRGYLGENPEEKFASAGIELMWSNHSAESGDSILTAIFDHKDPMDVVEQMGAV